MIYSFFCFLFLQIFDGRRFKKAMNLLKFIWDILIDVSFKAFVEKQILLAVIFYHIVLLLKTKMSEILLIKYFKFVRISF